MTAKVIMLNDMKLTGKQRQTLDKFKKEFTCYNVNENNIGFYSDGAIGFLATSMYYRFKITINREGELDSRQI